MKSLLLLAMVLAAHARPTFTSSAGDFTAAFGPSVREEKKTINTPNGPIDVVFCTYEGPQAVFQVFRIPTTASVAGNGRTAFFDGAREGLLRSTKGALIKEADGKLDGVPYREVTLRSKFPSLRGAPGIAVTRFYLSPPYSYSTQFLAAGEELSKDIEREGRAFLDSFRLTAKPADPPKDASPPAMPPPVPAAKVEWRKFRAKDGSFAVELPAEPVEAEMEAEGPAGPMKFATTACVAEGVAYTIVRVQIPADVPRDKHLAFFESNRDGILDEAKGKLLSERLVVKGTLPTYEIAYESPTADGLGKRSSLARITLQGRSLFTQTAIAPVGKLPVRNVQRFFLSFRPEAGAKVPGTKPRSKDGRMPSGHDGSPPPPIR